MIVKGESNEINNKNEWLERFLHSRYIFLICIAKRERMGSFNTSIDLSDVCSISQRYVWTLLGRLEVEGLVKKGKKIRRDGSYYYNYILTEQARLGLATLAENVHSFYKDG